MATLVCADVPKGVSVTLDHHQFDVDGELVGRGAWTGVRNLPPGAHFCATTPTSKGASTSWQSCFPTGFFFYVEGGVEGECHVVEWCAETESLVECVDDDRRRELEQRSRSDLDYLSRMLRYDPAWQDAWRGVSAHITAETIRRVSPVGSRIGVEGEPDDPSLASTPHERMLEEQLRRGGREEGAGATTSRSRDARCFYLDLPQLGGRGSPSARKFLEKSGLTGSALTALHLDKSPVLEDLLERELGGNHDELLGEMQFAFVCFLLCYSLTGFNQWKRLLVLALGSERSMLETRPEFAVELLRALRNQLELALREAEAAALVDEVLGEEKHFLASGIRGFLLSVAEAEVVPVAVEEEAARLAALVRSRLGVAGLEVEDDEDAPVVVQL